MDRNLADVALPWHIVEEAINRESKWLERVIEQVSIDKVPGCDECGYTFRKIALQDYGKGVHCQGGA